MQIQLDSAQKLRANWAFIQAEGLLPQLIEQGIITVAFEAAINAHVEWRIYDGRVDLRPIFRAFGETLFAAGDYKTFAISPQTAFMVAGLIMQQEPAVLAHLVAMNGGTMPDVLPPVVPAPPVEEPAPTPPQDPAPAPTPAPTENPQPVDPASDENND